MNAAIYSEIKLSSDHDLALAKVTEALKAEGFGILTTIDVRATLKEKIGEEFRPYTILGACNPHLAHRALSEDPTIGIMLPCNVTVEADKDGGSIIRIVNPETMLTAAKNRGAAEGIARDAGARLMRVMDMLVSAP